jgi:hypothetical protein
MSVQLLSWEGPLEPAHVASRLTAMLFGHRPGRIPPDALRAELLRAALWELSVVRPSGAMLDAAATTHQVLGRARALWEPLEGTLWTAPQHQRDGEARLVEEENDGLNRAFLDMLAEDGDVLTLGRGRWLPAPLRLVPLSDTLYVLVGGLPTALLPEPIRQDLRFHGHFRQIARGAIPATLAPHQDDHWQFQTQESWLGTLPPPGPELVEQFARQELTPVLRNDSPSLEAYVARLDQPLEWRWRSLEQVPDDRYLLRNTGSWGQGRYSIGEVRGHNLLKQGQIPPFIELRRLVHALATAAGAPARARWEHSGTILSLSSALPARERKKLAVLASPQEGQAYALYMWSVETQHNKEVWTLLTALGMRVQTEQRGEESGETPDE